MNFNIINPKSKGLLEINQKFNENNNISYRF